MTNLNFQNYNQQHLQPASQNMVQNVKQNVPMAYIPNMQGVPPSMQGLDYDTLKLHAQERVKDNAVTQATRHYSAETPEATAGTMLKSFLCSLLMSIGFTGATNWLMSSKKIADGVINAKDFTQTRLFRAGEFLDKKIGDTKLVKGAEKAVSAFQRFFSKITPNVVKEAIEKMKMGSIAVWDKQGMYSLGKGAEALNDFVDATTKVPTDKIKALLTSNGAAGEVNKVLDIIEKVKKGSIKGPVAFKELYPIFDKMPAKELAKLNEQGWFGKMLGLRTDLSSGLHKAKFFNGSLNKAQGPVARLFQKMSALVGEASGNGVLGGKLPLFMGAFGLMQGFTAAANAEKGDKLKAFMEDYIGFTLGSYLMSFVVGTWFNKFLGVTELGMNTNSKAFKNICKSLGLDSNTQRVQEAVIAFNREFKNIRKAKSVVEKLKANKITEERALSIVKDLVENKNLKVDLSKISGKHTLINSLTERISEFEPNGALRTAIKGAMKSELTIKKAGLGRYIVQKPLEVLGKILSFGRYSMMDGSKYSLKSIAKFAKRFGGGIGRMILVGFVLIEPFRNAFVKLSHFIFGKPKNSILAEKKNDEVVNELQNSQSPQLNQQPPQQVAQQSVQPQLQSQIPPSQSPQPMAAVPINNSEQMSVNNDVDAAIAATELSRKYVPSAQPSQFALQKDPREAQVENAILKAEKAEMATHNFLAKGI